MADEIKDSNLVNANTPLFRDYGKDLHIPRCDGNGFAAVVPGIPTRVVRARYSFKVTAGQNYVDSDTVPTNRFWVLRHLSYFDTTSAGTSWIISIRSAANITSLEGWYSPATGQIKAWDGQLIITEGEWVRATFNGAAVNDMIYLDVYAEEYSL
jgi:hypothetical protein